jgi:mercuric ion binding protein
MNLLRGILLSSLSLVLSLGGTARAETTVELKGVHLCCGACVKAVAATLKDIDGVKAKCDQKGKTVTLSAQDDAAAQKALNALAAAGFHGETGNDKLTIKDDSGASAGQVKSLTITGVHNCCGSCCKSIKEAVKKVNGVTADTATPKKNTFEVTGDFDAAQLVKALNTAGFHVQVKK